MKKYFISTILLFLVSPPAHPQQEDPVARWATLAASEYRVVSNIVYKKANGYDCKLDVIAARDASTARPTFIYFHGGGWMSGDKEGATLVGLPYLVNGMNFVNVEYRLASVSLAPAAVEDCRCAVRWVYLHAKEYGFDLTRLVVSGGSAGGHLSLMTGMLRPEDGFDNECAGPENVNLKVAAIVNDRGPTELTDLLEGAHRGWFAERWFGSLPNRLGLAKRLSPLNYVRSGLPPILTIQGDADEYVPYQQAVRLHEALTRARVTNQLFTIPGGKHGGFTPEQRLKIQETIFAFLRQQGIISK